MTDEAVHCDVDHGVAVLTLDNPPFNVVTLGLTGDLARHLDAIASDDSIRAVVVTGSGDQAFCAGSDIREFEVMMSPGAVVDKKLRRQNRVFARLANLPKPTIAALDGLTFGGGLEIACCCDFLIARSDVRLALPEIKLGVFPSSGGTFRVTRRIGTGHAKQMMFFGEPITAQTALDWGLVDVVVDEGTALTRALEWSRTLAERPAGALASCKSLIDAATELTTEELIAASLDASDRAFSSPDCREGVRAFFAKDTPDYRTQEKV